MNNLPPNMNNIKADGLQKLQESKQTKDSAENNKPAEFEYTEGSSLNLNPASVIGQSMVKPYQKSNKEIFEEFEQTKQFLLQQKYLFLNERSLNAPVFTDHPERADRVNKFVNFLKDKNIELIKNANLSYFLKEDDFNLLMDYIKKNPQITNKELNKQIAEFKRQEERAIISETETKKIKNPMVKEVATEAFLRMRIGAEKFEDIETKMHNIQDPNVLDYVNTSFSEMKEALDSSDVFYGYHEHLQKIDICLDAYHTLNSNYEHIGDSNNKALYSQKRKYVDFVKKNPDSDNYIHSKLENGVQEEDLSNNDYSLYDSADEGKWKDFLSEGKLERLKDFCENFPNDEMPDYLYKEYYLKNQNIPKIFTEKLDKINKEFNTKVFLSHADIEKAAQELDFVYNELSQWKKHSNGQAKFPPVLDLSKIKQDYIDKTSAYNKSTSAGYARQNTKYIALNGYNNIRYALRHELMHANDLKHGRNINPAYNLADIMPKTLDNGVSVPDFDKCLYRNEFLRAGIKTDHIKYAYNNTMEFIAVASEGDMSKYSPEFKSMLIDFGMPEWAFNLEVLDKDKKEQAEKIDTILKLNKQADIGVPFNKIHEEINKFNKIKRILEKNPNNSKTPESVYKETLDIYNNVYDIIPDYLDGDSIAEKVVRHIMLLNANDLVNDKLDKKELIREVKTIRDEGLKHEPAEKLNGKYFGFELGLLDEFKDANKQCIQKHPEMKLKYNPELIYKTYKIICSELNLMEKSHLIIKVFDNAEEVIPVLNGSFNLREYIDEITS